MAQGAGRRGQPNRIGRAALDGYVSGSPGYGFDGRPPPPDRDQDWRELINTATEGQLERPWTRAAGRWADLRFPSGTIRSWHDRIPKAAGDTPTKRGRPLPVAANLPHVMTANEALRELLGEYLPQVDQYRRTKRPSHG